MKTQRIVIALESKNQKRMKCDVLSGLKKIRFGLWHALDRKTGKVLAYVLGRRKDEVFR